MYVYMLLQLFFNGFLHMEAELIDQILFLNWVHGDCHPRKKFFEKGFNFCSRTKVDAPTINLEIAKDAGPREKKIEINKVR